MEFSKEFKQALSAFSSKEKDKLIFRLLKKDRILSHRLYFELIDPETTDEKRSQMEAKIRDLVPEVCRRYGKTKYLLTQIRKLSGSITEHVKITTDKFGEVSLNLLLVTLVLEAAPNYGNTYKLHVYLLNKIFRTLVLTQKLDPDYLLELREPFESLKKSILRNEDFKELAWDQGLDMRWLDPDEIPEHMDLLLKDLRAQGLLR